MEDSLLSKVVAKHFNTDDYLVYSPKVYFIKVKHFNCVNGNNFTVSLCQDENGIYFSDLGNVRDELEDENLDFTLNKSINLLLDTYNAKYIDNELRVYVDDDSLFERYYDSFIQLQSIIYFLFMTKSK